MFSMLLCRIAPPQNSRDRLTITRVVRDLKFIMLILAGSLVAGAYGVTVWDSRMGHVLVELAAVAIAVGLVHAGTAIRRLQREMAFRALCRRKRLALPHVLADGVSAAERMDIRKTAEAISFRIRMRRDFNEPSLAIFDVLLADIFENNPDFAQGLREWGEQHRRKA